MEENYIISIDQSTQGTKALLFDRQGKLLQREDLPHRQKVNEKGWVSHDPEEIYRNVIKTVKKLIENSGIDRKLIKGIGISNQRETSLIWDKYTGKPVADAVVWQCSRAAEICERVKKAGISERISEKTGLKLSPYFPAAKFAWLQENTEGALEKAERHELCYGTIDTWLVYKLTDGTSYKTDYSNASRTLLFNIFDLEWDNEICRKFGIDSKDLPEVCESDSWFGETDLEGLLLEAVPIHAVLGDSHAALFGQGCVKKGMVKATYGTGSSIMMNVGGSPVLSSQGIVTSLGWKMQGKVNYVLEGNINYTGAVVSWLKDEVKLIQSPAETEGLCKKADSHDNLYFVPAFTGLGAPYWDSQAEGMLMGITRTTGREEIVRAGVESIAYQIADVVKAMEKDSGILINELRVDGGPTRNTYLMQFQSDLLMSDVLVPKEEELSGIGAAYAAGKALRIYSDEIFMNIRYQNYRSKMSEETRKRKNEGWKRAIRTVLSVHHNCINAPADQNI